MNLFLPIPEFFRTAYYSMEPLMLAKLVGLDNK